MILAGSVWWRLVLVDKVTCRKGMRLDPRRKKKNCWAIIFGEAIWQKDVSLRVTNGTIGTVIDIPGLPRWHGGEKDKRCAGNQKCLSLARLKQAEKIACLKNCKIIADFLFSRTCCCCFVVAPVVALNESSIITKLPRDLLSWSCLQCDEEKQRINFLNKHG